MWMETSRSTVGNKVQTIRWCQDKYSITKNIEKFNKNNFNDYKLEPTRYTSVHRQ